jgi:hypothetical protein
MLRVLNGRLTKAIERMKRWRHYGPDDAAEIIEVAELLEERGEPYTRPEYQLLGLGERLALLTRAAPRAPRPPSPFDGRIAETERDLAIARQVYNDALAEVEAARDDERSAVARFGAAAQLRDTHAVEAAERDIEAARARSVHASAELLIADHGWLRHRGRLTALEALRSRWHAEQESTVQGPNGETMTIAEFSRAMHGQ